jgi:hypothetical protein
MAKRNARGTKGRTNSGKVKKGFRGKMRGNNNAKKPASKLKQPRRSKTSNRKPGVQRAARARRGNPTMEEFKMSHKKNKECPLISLDLDDLNLDILGLNVHIPCLEVQVTGDEDGGLLGSLLCGLLGPNSPALLRAMADEAERRGSSE